MMQVSFDLISDLHIEDWPTPFDWSGMPTSMVCVVAGDVSKDKTVVIDTLKHLGQVYKAVIYIDGNAEHRDDLYHLEESYTYLVEEIRKIENVVYLQDNVVVIDGVGFVGTNGWWTYDFDNHDSYDYSKQWFTEVYNVNMEVANTLEVIAMQDVKYMSKSIAKLQTHRDIKKIVCVTHTPPSIDLISHDIELAGSHRLNCTGNSHLMKAFLEDTESKIDTWCFGHYHGDIDTTIDGVRFVNNARGRHDTPWCKQVYHPKKIIIKI